MPALQLFLIGAPRCGKTTVFEALTNTPEGRHAASKGAHHLGTVKVPDARLADLRDFQVEDPRRVIVLYCTGSACTDSHDLAQRLFALGLPNLRIYTGGYPAWARHGRPVAKGAQP